MKGSYLLKARLLVLVGFAVLALLCGLVARTAGLKNERVQSRSVETGYGAPVHLTDLKNRSVNESSGIVASRRNSNLFWTHNDSGDGPFIYAFDRGGNHLGVWRVAGATARDWEDIAIGPGPTKDSPYVYIGDIGDNEKKRDEIVVY